jgi:hypothetical protein
MLDGDGTWEVAYTLIGPGRFSGPFEAWIEVEQMGADISRRRISNVMTLQPRSSMPPPPLAGRPTGIPSFPGVPAPPIAPPPSIRPPSVGKAPRPPAPPSRPEPKVLDDAALDALLAQLGDSNQFKVRSALDKLAKSEPADRRAEVAGAIEALLTSSDGFTRNSAAGALKTWCGPESEPALIQALDDESFVVRHHAIATLGKLKTAEGAAAVARVYRQNGIQAKAALLEMGPVAEDAVRSLLEHQEWPVRNDACNILGQIGGEKSVPLLKKMQQDENGLVRWGAQRAIEAIEKRKDA